MSSLRSLVLIYVNVERRGNSRWRAAWQNQHAVSMGATVTRPRTSGYRGTVGLIGARGTPSGSRRGGRAAEKRGSRCGLVYARSSVEHAIRITMLLWRDEPELSQTLCPADLTRERSVSVELDKAIMEVCEKMKPERDKPRVTFYYLLAEKYGKLATFG
jgi:hypothetical protein